MSLPTSSEVTLPRDQSGGRGRRHPQGIFWIGTIPASSWTTPDALPSGIAWLRGQLEEGEGGYRHYQVVCGLDGRGRLSRLKSIFGNASHWELTRSRAAEEYVWKEATRVAGSQFELGVRPINPNSRTDWESIWELAKRGNLDAIPAHVRVCSYRSIRSIEVTLTLTLG